MIIVNKVIDDAEDKQHIDPYVKQWLGELKDVVYEAEDLLDEIASEVQQWRMEPESRTALDEVQDFASSHNPFKTGKKEKLEEILETLEDLIDQKDALGLIGDIGEKPSYRRVTTTTIPDESVTYGRDADKEAIMKWVLFKDANSNNQDVLAMVGMDGMGGMGKTIIAYMNGLVERHGSAFQKNLLFLILLKISLKDSPSNLQILTILILLKDNLSEKIFLLVLNNVWNKKYSEWNHLLKPLRLGGKESEILFAIQNEDVLQNIQVSLSYLLKKLSDNDC